MTKQPYTFASALKVYIAELRARRHKRRSAGSDAWFLRRYLLDPATNPFMDRPIAAVTDTDIADFLRSLSDRPALAHRCTRKIRAFFAWAMRPARRQKFGLRCSPAANIMPPGRPRQNVLDEEELRAYLAAAETLGPPRGTLAEGLALTGLPPSLIGRMRWSELDLDRKTWTVPKGHACPVVFALSQAFAVRLAEMRAGPAGAGEFVFSADGGRTPLVHLGRMRSELGRAADLDMRRIRRLHGDGWICAARSSLCCWRTV